MFDQIQMKQLIQAAEQAWYACPLQTCLIRGCPKKQDIAHQTREQKKSFEFLIECLMAFKFYQTRVWSCLIKFEGHQTFHKKLKLFLLFSCLMGDVLFVWTATYQTCLMRACVPRLLSGLYQLFDPCLIKRVLTVWPLTSISACLVTKQCLMVFGLQTFLV